MSFHWNSDTISDQWSGLGKCRRRIHGAWHRLTVLVAIATLVAGCGKSAPREVHLQGEVTLNGAPVPEDATAFITFAPANGSEAKSVSVPVKAGHYDSPRTPAGEVTVLFEITRAVGPEKKSERTGLTYRDTENLLPAKYATGVPLEVTSDNANQDFHLTD